MTDRAPTHDGISGHPATPDGAAEHPISRNDTADRPGPRDSANDHPAPRDSATDHPAPRNGTADHPAPRDSAADHASAADATDDAPTADHTAPRSTSSDRAENRPATSGTEAVVSVRDLRKAYGQRSALDGVTFDIRRGETFALLGPNGAGKSTTIEILEGYRDRTGGDAQVLGTDPQRGGVAWKARIGIVLQSSGESGNVTVREQLTQFASMYPNARSVDEVIEAVGLTDKARTRIKALSGGQRRRVDVALGVIGRPELLFLDEPTTGFDPEARRHFWELIRSLKREGTTILLTTHYLDEAAQLSDRAAIIAGGRIIDMGRIDEIGGADARIPLVRWREPNGEQHEERTTEPAALVSRLYTEHGREPDALELIRPSLEDIYLGLVEADEARESAKRDQADDARTSPGRHTGTADAASAGTLEENR